MELIILAIALAIAAFFGNLRLVALCALIAVAFGWYYERMPAEQQQQVITMYTDVRNRCERAWNAFVE